jgi:ankyrin repeat protein
VFAASQNRLDAMRMLIEKGANSRLETTVIDYAQRSAADSASRIARDKVITATTGKAPTAPAQFDPPQTGRAATVGGTGQAAPDPAAGRGRGAAGPRPASDIQQIGKQGGLTALHYVARDGFVDAAMMLLDSGMDVNVPTAGDRSTPLLVAIINGNYDLAMAFLKRGANPNIASDDGAGPLFVALNNEWALRTWYPQPTASNQQRASHLELMESLLKAGADPNARTMSHIWYAAYNAGRMGVDYTGATPFWRAAYSLDVDAMRLLVKYGADPNIPTMSFGAAARNGLPAIPTGGPAASATARHAWRSSIGMCLTAGCQPPSTSSKNWAWTSTSVTPMVSRHCIWPPREATTR